jgi:hypothetical protein
VLLVAGKDCAAARGDNSIYEKVKTVVSARLADKGIPAEMIAAMNDVADQQPAGGFAACGLVEDIIAGAP